MCAFYYHCKSNALMNVAKLNISTIYKLPEVTLCRNVWLIFTKALKNHVQQHLC